MKRLIVVVFILGFISCKDSKVEQQLDIVQKSKLIQIELNLT